MQNQPCACKCHRQTRGATNSDSKMLPVSACLTSLIDCAPRAILSDICRLRSMPRTSIRLATLAQTISNTNPETIISI